MDTGKVAQQINSSRKLAYEVGMIINADNPKPYMLRIRDKSEAVVAEFSLDQGEMEEVNRALMLADD